MLVPAPAEDVARWPEAFDPQAANSTISDTGATTRPTALQILFAQTARLRTMSKRSQKPQRPPSASSRTPPRGTTVGIVACVRPKPLAAASFGCKREGGKR